MPNFELPQSLRREICGGGFHDIDAALRAAAVELDLWFFASQLHWSEGSDGEFRHYTQFLSWADTALVGIHRAVERTGDQAFMGRWQALGSEPLRVRFGNLRDRALKGREDVAQWRAAIKDDGVLLFRTLGGDEPEEVIGVSGDYLRWLRDFALPFLVEAIDRGVHGRTQIDDEFPLTDQMYFPWADPWTPEHDPELRALLGLKQTKGPDH